MVIMVMLGVIEFVEKFVFFFKSDVSCFFFVLVICVDS